eukprot:2141405-Pleurochrysis_carterae.AAC.1
MGWRLGRQEGRPTLVRDVDVEATGNGFHVEDVLAADHQRGTVQPKCKRGFVALSVLGARGAFRRLVSFGACFVVQLVSQ